MSTIIKLKNSSNSSAPVNLEQGELAIGTLAGFEKLYFKNSEDSIININDWSRIQNKPPIEMDPNGDIKINGNVYATGGISAYGIGAEGGGTGLIQSVYDSTELGGTYLDSDKTDTFNAYTINQLAGRITTLEGGASSNISISTTGAGNAITSATKSGDVITFAKDSTFVLTNDSRLTNARYNPYAITFTGYTSAIYDGSNSVTIALPTKLSQFINDIETGTTLTKASVEAVLTGNITSHTHNYLTGNQTISVTGDATGSGTTSIALTLANSGVTAGTYRSVTVDVKGRVTGGTNPTTLSGYGISDAAPLSHVGLTGSAHGVATTSVNGFMSSIDKTKLDGIATGANNYTHPTSGVTAGTYKSVTVNVNGHITEGTNPTTLAGYGILDAASSSHTHNYAGSSSAGGKANAVANQLTFSGYSTLSYDGSTAVTIPIPNNTSQLTNGAGYITASGSITGNAGTATALQNSRTIWGQSFNGTANVTGALSNVTNLTMSGTLNVGSAQLIYDSTTNTLRVQKSDGSAIGFYSTGEVASYGVGSAGGNSYVTATKFIVSGDIVSNNSIYTGGKTSSIDGLPGTVFNKAGGLEICGPNPLIDFHYNSSTEDFTSRLIEFFSGQISISNKFRVGDMYTYNGSYAFYVTGTSYLNGDTTINGAINSTGTGTFTGGSFSSLRSLKTVHNDWQGNALNEIAKFKIRSFNYKNNPLINKTLGLIVDEIPESISEYLLMGENKDSVNLYTLHSLSLLGLQETKTEIELLKEKVSELENKIKELENK